MTLSMQTTSKGSGGWRSAAGGARSFATSRRGLLLIAAAAVGGGLAANWGWMIAIGAAPLILGLLPCAAMCALGTCMPMMMGGPKKKENEPLTIDAKANPGELSALPPQLVTQIDTSPNGRMANAVDTPKLLTAAEAHSCCAPTEERTSHA